MIWPRIAFDLRLDSSHLKVRSVLLVTDLLRLCYSRFVIDMIE